MITMKCGVVCVCLLVVATAAALVSTDIPLHSIGPLSVNATPAAAAAAADDDAAQFSDSSCSVALQAAAVHCANRSLGAVPAGLPAFTRTLDFSHNQLTQLTAENLRHLSAVEVISLRNNALTAISSDAFVNCTSLRRLYLDHNELSSVTFVHKSRLQELHASFNRITSLETGHAILPLTALDLSFNSVQMFNSSVLWSLRNVRMLNLSHNVIEAVAFDDPLALLLSEITHVDVSWNKLETVRLCNDCYSHSLQYLDMSGNHLRSVYSSWCQQLSNLTVLNVGRNPISTVAPGTFRHCSSLRTLHMDRVLIRQIDAEMFRGLARLRTLRLDHNRQLVSLQRHSFRDLVALVELDLSSCSLTTLEPETFMLPTSLSVIDLGDNAWHCDCEEDTAVVWQLSVLSSRGVHVSDDTVCIEPASMRGVFVPNVFSEHDECLAAAQQALQETVWAHVGHDLLLDCNATTHELNVSWYWKQNGNVVPVIAEKFDDHVRRLQHTADALVLRNGSLYITSVSRATAGQYYCIASSRTTVLSVRLNSDAISMATLHSIIVGLLSAAGFFLVAVVIGIARYLSYLCSRKERRKRKSIRAVLESIQDYKCAQFDRFSAYRTAKMDQLSAFKSAKIEQLSAFRDARVDRLRTYKQATVASILTHIERMREHYVAQTARIKDNCAQQADRLRERYSVRRGRFKDYRSHRVDKMRENYAAQSARIREYGLVQMSRLREQYKTQQQYVLKLVELLDVGSCVSGVIEAECMKAESMIFDADIAFDFEAQPARANESLMGSAASAAAVDESSSSHYVSASDSDLSISSEDYNITCVADVSMPVHGRAETTDTDDMTAGVLAVADDVLAHLVLYEPRSVSEDHQVSSSVIDDQTLQAAGSAEDKEMTCVASDNTTEQNCVELAGISDDTGQGQVDGAAEQDTSF